MDNPNSTKAGIKLNESTSTDDAPVATADVKFEADVQAKEAAEAKEAALVASKAAATEALQAKEAAKAASKTLVIPAKPTAPDTTGTIKATVAGNPAGVVSHLDEMGVSRGITMDISTDKRTITIKTSDVAAVREYLGRFATVTIQ